jgi:hypothetical protein
MSRLRPDYHDETFLIPASEDHFVIADPNSMWASVVFYELANGAWYVHIGSRATPLVSRSVRSR